MQLRKKKEELIAYTRTIIRTPGEWYRHSTTASNKEEEYKSQLSRVVIGGTSTSSMEKYAKVYTAGK